MPTTTPTKQPNSYLDDIAKVQQMAIAAQQMQAQQGQAMQQAEMFASQQAQAKAQSEAASQKAIFENMNKGHIFDFAGQAQQQQVQPQQANPLMDFLGGLVKSVHATDQVTDPITGMTYNQPTPWMQLLRSMAATEAPGVSKVIESDLTNQNERVKLAQTLKDKMMMTPQDLAKLQMDNTPESVNEWMKTRTAFNPWGDATKLVKRTTETKETPISFQIKGSKDALTGIYDQTTKTIKSGGRSYTLDQVELGKPTAFDLISMTDEGVDLAAEQYIATGAFPPGMSRNQKMTSKVIDRVAKMAKEDGLTVKDILANGATYLANRGSLRQLTTLKDRINSFAKTVDKNLQLVDSLSNKIDRSGVPVINRFIMAGKSEVAGDKDVAAYNAALRTAINEYAKVISSASGGGQTSDTARKEVEGLLNNAHTPEQVKDVIALLRKEIANRQNGFTEQINGITSEIRGSAQPVQPAGQVTILKVEKL